MSDKALGAAWERLRRGDAQGARDLLADILAREPRLAEAHRLLGMAYRRLGRPVEAEAAFRSAIAADKKDPAHHAEYAAFLEAAGRLKEAERAFRAALSLNRRFAPAATGLALLLIDQGRADEAVRVTTPLAMAGAPGSLMAAHGRALKEAGRFADAEACFRDIVRRQPSTTAHQDLAELVWLRTADVEAATQALDADIAARPELSGLTVIKAWVLTQVGQAQAATRALDEALAAAPGDPTLLAARSKLPGAHSLAQAQAALATSPNDPDAGIAAARAYLAEGRPKEAEAALETALERRPYDQLALALQATAWRMSGDRRYAEACDYDRLVQFSEIATPRGWPDLAAYLGELAAALHRLHPDHAHPFGQSVRGGSQVVLRGAQGREVAALGEALSPAIDAYIESLARSGHPMARRATGAWRFASLWSIRLRTAGYHDNHVHPEGWISSACYIDLPLLAGREGWLKFGEPGLTLKEPLPAERHVEPRPGRLVLFPSSMWHGTEPFVSDKPRLTVAFDVIPA